MKNIFAIAVLLCFLVACSKNKNPVLLNEATVTFLHHTCVKTILKIDTPNTFVGVSWSNQLLANPGLYQHVIGAGNMKNAPAEGLHLLKQYKVKIYSKATGPDIACALYDPVNDPGINYNIEFLP